MADRSIYATRPRRQTRMDRHLNELISYGGELWTRADITRDLKRMGAEDRMIDRYLQGAEQQKRLEANRLRSTPPTSLLQ